MSIKRGPFVAGVLVPIFLSGTAAATDGFDDIRANIRHQLTEQSVPSLAVAVAKDGKIVWEEGFGWADRERRIPATQHTVYSLASVSKPFTATGVMVLVRDGKLSLDKPINDYLAGAKLTARVGDASAATVRRIANHTAGLPLHYQFFYQDEPQQRPPMNETLLRYGNLVTAPGEVFEYSNLGYGVLDYVIARASGRSFAEFMRREVFLPLGLTRTCVNIDPSLQDHVATRYDTNGKPLPFYDFDHPGGSAIFASAHDLVRFGLFHLKTHRPDQKAILSDAAIDEMHRRASGDDEYGYGIGFGVAKRDGYTVVTHSGGMAGVSTRLVLFPDEQLALVTLSNSSNDVASSVANQIAAKFLPNWKVRSQEQEQAKPQPAFVAPSTLLGKWQGSLATYVGNLSFELEFLPGGDVHARLGDQLATLVNHPSFENNTLTGVFNGRIGTPDTERYDYTIQLSLKKRGDVLNGAAIAVGIFPTPDGRVRNALAHWLELRKAK